MAKKRFISGLAKTAKGKVASGAKQALPKAKTKGVPNLPKRRPAPKPKVSDRRLQNLVNNIWKHAGKRGTAGDGTLGDAVRNELRTGRPSNGIWHTDKAIDTMNGLAKWLKRNRNAPADERQLAQNLLNDLKDALRGR